jgi:tetratricopeptide (TPR) repeat protein
MEDIEGLIAHDQLEQARVQLAAARAERPADPHLRFLDAALAAREGRFRDAAIALVELLAFVPDSALATLLHGRVQYRLGQVDAARASFDDALSLDPRLAGVYFQPSDVAVLNADLGAAQTRYREGLQADPSNEELRLALAGVLLRQGELDDVLFELQPLLERAEPSPSARLLAAATELVRSRYDQALALLDQIGTESAGSELAPALLRLQVLYWAGRLAQADRLAGQLLEGHPDLYQVWVLRAEILLAGGRLQAAFDAAGRALTSRPQHARAIRTQAVALLRLDTGLTGEALLLRHLEDHPNDSPSWRALLAFMANRQAHAEAIPMARRWTEACPLEADSHADLAALLEHQGELDAAMQAARSALRLQSDHINALLVAARAELRIGRPGPVLAKLDRVLPAGLEQGQQEARLALLARAADAQKDPELAAQRWQERHRDSPSLATLRPFPAAAQVRVPPAQGPHAPASDRVAFLIGLPGSGVQHLAASLQQHPGIALLSDRFSAAGRFDGFSQPDWATLQRGLSEGQAMILRRRWRKALQRQGTLPASRLLVDWLPHIDVLLHSAIASIFPGAPVIVVERDLRDTLLDWLAFPGQHRLRFESAALAGEWLAAAASHYRAITESDRTPLVRVRFEDLLAEPQATLDRASAALGLETGLISLRTERTLGDLPGFHPPGHSSAYQDALSEAFKALRKANL